MTEKNSYRQGDIIKEFAPYKDGWGLVQPFPGRGSFNGVRYTAEYVLALLKNGRLDQERQELLRVYESVQKKPGLLMRTPDNAGGYESIDDTVAAITAGYFLGNTFARDFLNYGRNKTPQEADMTDSNKEKAEWGRRLFNLLRKFGEVQWVFNNLNPETFAISSYMGRFQHLVAHAQFAENEPVPIWRQIWWSGAIVLSALNKEYQDGKVLAWHMILVAKGKSALCDMAIEFWIDMLKEHYPEGIGQVLGDYYQTHDHAAAKWLRYEFGE